MKTFRLIVFPVFILICFSQLFAAPQRVPPNGPSIASKTAKSLEEARAIEDKRYNDEIAGLDAKQRKIWADWLTDKIACGNDSKTNQGCLKAAAQKRDKQLALNDQARAQANAFHANQIDAIYKGDLISSVGGGNPSVTPSGGSPDTGDPWAGGGSGTSASRPITINCTKYGANQLICQDLPGDCNIFPPITKGGNRRIVCDSPWVNLLAPPQTSQNRPPATQNPQPTPVPSSPPIRQTPPVPVNPQDPQPLPPVPQPAPGPPPAPNKYPTVLNQPKWIQTSGAVRLYRTADGHIYQFDAVSGMGNGAYYIQTTPAPKVVKQGTGTVGEAFYKTTTGSVQWLFGERIQ